jgi:hypothetical protein
MACTAIALAGCESPGDPVAPPGGGEEFVLEFASFTANVAPVLEQYGCHAMECHGGGIRGTFQLSPEDAVDPAYDFDQVVLQVDPWAPDSSPILQKPLAESGGGATHAWEPFDSPQHAGYVAIRDWILAGEFQ